MDREKIVKRQEKLTMRQMNEIGERDRFRSDPDLQDRILKAAAAVSACAKTLRFAEAVCEERGKAFREAQSNADQARYDLHKAENALRKTLTREDGVHEADGEEDEGALQRFAQAIGMIR